MFHVHSLSRRGALCVALFSLVGSLLVASPPLTRPALAAAGRVSASDCVSKMTLAVQLESAAVPWKLRFTGNAGHRPVTRD